MDNNIRREIQFFLLSDYEEEEKYLEEMHRMGWKFRRMKLICYEFEKCEPENVVYRLDFNTEKNDNMREYVNLFREYGWEYIQDCNNFSYFRRSADGSEECESEIFSDNFSRAEMVRKIVLSRLLPIYIIYAGILLQLKNNYDIMIMSGMSDTVSKIWAVFYAFYTFAVIHCTVGLIKLGRKYGG